ncbi:CLUMA_CG019709, isoform A [Clunio marinus]|uniref:CLUMA_CG019709, isoform A n=1 Tax=Clunio marinus TaxID=568069 RepID=A0A1J1J2G5_9DIPT|nr:CLUMA_CG019709, isoform A [Clunio marinus]
MLFVNTFHMEITVKIFLPFPGFIFSSQSSRHLSDQKENFSKLYERMGSICKGLKFFSAIGNEVLMSGWKGFITPQGIYSFTHLACDK